MDRRALIGLALVAASAGSAAAAAPASDSGGAPANSYINLNSINGSVTRASGRRGVLTVDVGVDVPDMDLRATAASAGPRLRAEMVQVVQTFAAGLRPGEPPDVAPPVPRAAVRGQSGPGPSRRPRPARHGCGLTS